MDTLSLTESLRQDASGIDRRSLKESLARLESETGVGPPTPLQRLRRYNLETMLELKDGPAGPGGPGAGDPRPVDGRAVEALKAAVDAYMDRHAPGDAGLKGFVRTVSVYLAFVAGRPLHPGGMFDRDGRVEYRDGKVVCPIRAREMAGPDSLCRFCAAVSQGRRDRGA